MQNRQELLALCAWIETQQIRSYLEIGIWTGQLISCLDELFGFDKLAVCDLRQAEQLGLPIQVPVRTQTFWGSSHSIEFMAWRHALGPMDLVFIDGDHSLAGVKRDFELNLRYPHRYLAFHDIAGSTPSTVGVRSFWEGLPGIKHEIILPNPENRGMVDMGIGIWCRE